MSEIVCLKQSGEDLGDDEGPVTSESVEQSAMRLQEVAEGLANLNIAGLLVVSGGGNIMRGRAFPAETTGPTLSRRADAIARWGTAMNTWALDAALEDLGVPHQVFMAPGMQLLDPTLDYPPFDLDAIHEAYLDDKMVLMAGGFGRDRCSTDLAVAKYAILQAETGRYSNVAPYKSTNVPGVYNKNPREYVDAQFIPGLSAAEALEMGIQVVDEQSLIALRDYRPEEGMPDVGLRVYSGEDHSLLDVIRSERAGAPLGSMIMSGSARVYA